MADRPVVFISSTCEDLEKTKYRSAARDAALGAGFYPEMLEYWEAKDNPPLDECLERVDGADVLVVIVAERFGWVPEGQDAKDANERKSITWLECERAKKNGRDILAFLVDEDYDWPAERREEYRVTEAIGKNEFTPELGNDVQWRVNRLKEFKAWLNNRAVRVTFTTPEDLRGKVVEALLKWSAAKGLGRGRAVRRCDPAGYLRRLREETSHIEIRGLQVESGKAHRFPIDQLYIPLKTTVAGEREALKGGKRGRKVAQPEAHQRAIELHRALKNRRLVILGDPGAGKTTFARRIAYGLCNTGLGIEAATTAHSLGLEKEAFGVLIRISELAEHIEASCGQKRGEPTIKTSPAWLAHFLAANCGDKGAGLDREFFETKIKDGPAVVLLDGLDETPTREQREGIAELVSKAAGEYRKSRFVVTSRPPAFEGGAVLPEFEQVSIDPLEDEAIEGFLRRWCEALFSGSERQAAQHLEGLLKAIRSRVEIRRMARNPVMLTALAVVHWHEKRLPEQRADLYESIITWLSRSRKRGEGRLSADICVNRLQELALAMQNHEEGRQVQVPRRWAAEQIAGEWSKVPGVPERQRIATAERFLAEEELDSGIVVERGDDIRFWHLTFQEFLAARATAARPEQEQNEILLTPAGGPRLYLPDWREVVLLLGGVLHKQGHRKVDNFISAVLDSVGPAATLADEARCAGLLGAMVRDLSAANYRPGDVRYEELLDRVMSIFDAERSAAIDIKDIIAAADALGQAGDPRFAEDALKDNWVDIPAGRFLMGAQKKDPSKPNYDDYADDDEFPVHEVMLDGFRMGRYPVTVGEYLRFVEAGGYGEERLWEARGFGKWTSPKDWDEQLGHLNRPVVGVSWFEGAAYARWRGCRLPTEAEWERAARGPEGRRYPWGDSAPNTLLANYGEGKVGAPTPVGIYPRGATAEGLVDMAGNVWEWCSDWFGGYSKAAAENPRGPASGGARCLRGGSWLDYGLFLRCSYRFNNDPVNRGDVFGFRVVFSQS